MSFHRRNLLFICVLALVVMAPTQKYQSGQPIPPTGTGEANTASNLGGGLSNFSSKNGVDLRFNSFSPLDFTLTSHLIGVNVDRWFPSNIVVATKDLAAPTDALTGADIAAAIAACGSGICQVNLGAGTYTDVCIEITRNNTHIIGRGCGVTILKPYIDLDDCTATEVGAMLTFRGVDNVELAYMELDGGKNFLSPATCDENFCGEAIREDDSLAGRSNYGWFHHLCVHDFAGSGLETDRSSYWVLEHSDFTNFGCDQTVGSGNTCGCGAGDPGNCRGWNLEPDPGLGHMTQANDMSWFGATYNSIARFSTFGVATHAGIEIAGDCINYPNMCPDNDELSDNVVNTSIVVNGGNHARVLRNRVSNPGEASGTGDIGVGILVTAQSINQVLIEDNLVTNSASSGIVAKPTGPGDLTIRGNILSNNCQDHNDNGDIWIWGNNSGGIMGYPRDLLVENNHVTGSSGCTYGLKAADDGQPFAGSVRYIGGSYAAGIDGAVKVDNGDLEMRGLKVNGNLIFDTNARGLAVGNTVSGSITNTGGVCIMTNSATPIPSSCVAP